jgi:hypothetical protein
MRLLFPESDVVASYQSELPVPHDAVVTGSVYDNL